METLHIPSDLLSGNAMRVLERRYLRRDAAGKIVETPEAMFRRVAQAVSKAELSWGTPENAALWEQRFFRIMNDLWFLPNSPTLMNAGTGTQQLSACFVLPVGDHLDSIFETLRLAALIQQSGGGTGFNFSHVRPKDDPLFHTQGTASGPVSFIRIFDAATEHIRQGGKRRGANMAIMNVDHPDIEEFAGSKSREGELKNFNISVGITDAFMKTLAHRGKWNLLHPNSGRIVKTVNAHSLWETLVHNAWTSGDPGLVFLDTINAANPTPHLGAIETTNPCGEVPLLPYESCNLGSVNLSKFAGTTGKTTFDWNRLEETVTTAIRFLDDVIEINGYLSPAIRQMAFGNRKIGLGVMGWADALCRLGIPYDTDKAVELGEEVMRFISGVSRRASVALAEKRGPFEHWERSIYYPREPIRNATRTSIAPTGTISIIAGTSSSIEPFFALAYRRKHVLHDEVLEEMNSRLLGYLADAHLDAPEILEQIHRSGTLQGILSIPDNIKSIFRTALEIDASWHLRHQAAFQKFTDNAVSKTINLPEDSSPMIISEIYRQAWQMKLKGITVFRNRSRSRQVIEQGITGDIKACKVCIE